MYVAISGIRKSRNPRAIAIPSKKDIKKKVPIAISPVYLRSVIDTLSNVRWRLSPHDLILEGGSIWPSPVAFPKLAVCVSTKKNRLLVDPSDDLWSQTCQRNSSVNSGRCDHSHEIRYRGPFLKKKPYSRDMLPEHSICRCQVGLGRLGFDLEVPPYCHRRRITGSQNFIIKGYVLLFWYGFWKNWVFSRGLLDAPPWSPQSRYPICAIPCVQSSCRSLRPSLVVC